MNGMENTRHFVTTVFVVNGNQSLLHDHKKLDLALPPGGHIDRDELPHEAAKREVVEETGLDVELHPDGQEITGSEWSKPIPKPNQLLLDDIIQTEGETTHQHINHVYFASTEDTEINPQGQDEVTSEDWYWVTEEQLENENEPLDVDPLTREICLKSIRFVNNQ